MDELMKNKTPWPLAIISLIVSVGFFSARASPFGRSVIPLAVVLDGQGQQLEINQEERDGNELQPPDKVMDAADVRAGMAIGGRREAGEAGFAVVRIDTFLRKNQAVARSLSGTTEGN